MKMNCIIIDDEPVARKLLEEYIQDVDYLELKGKAENPIKATGLLNEHHIDLIFLDINMPKLSGIEFLRMASSLPPVILTTAYAEYALDGFELDVLDYLLKPFSFERFMKAVNRAKDYHLINTKEPDAKPDNYFFVKCEGKIEKIYHDDLLYVEALQNYVTLYTESGKLIVYLTMKGVAEKLPANKFLKVHKSYIVNVSKIKSIEGNVINLGSSGVTISQGMYDEVIKEILKDKMLKR